MKLPVDKKWFEKRAAQEGDLEIGAGSVSTPKPCRHCYDHTVAAGRGAVFNIYRCRYCGDEEWL